MFSFALSRSVVTSYDGTPLGVQTVTSANTPPDAPVLLLANGLGATVTAYRYLLTRFSRTFRFVSWDYRGLYASGRPVGGYDSLDVACHAKDALAVLEALGLDEVHALGWSMGVQVLIELYRHAPDRFATLVLHNGVAGRPWDSVAGTELFKGLMDPVLAASQRVDFAIERAVARVVDWEGFLPLAMRAGLVSRELDREVFLDVAGGFKTLDMHLYIELLRRLGRHDAYDVLPQIAVPTLILQGAKDVLTPLATAERMARAIPGAQLAVLPGGTHYAAVEMPDELNRYLARFWEVAGLEVGAPGGGT
ncbi:MAG: alpha/beta fold hydrolase [Deltaproteobacteria bacterium]|nr:alpha/beta fold hydrolase [Deltaproteobacteria bacterium]